MFPFVEYLKSKYIVLASASPRRREILSKLGLSFKVIPSTFPETLVKTHDIPSDYVLKTAIEKAQQVARQVSSNSTGQEWAVIGADTIVHHNNTILEKPSTRQEAHSMLSSFSNSQNQVLTAVVVIFPLKHNHSPEALEQDGITIIPGSIPMAMRTWVETTTVQFGTISNEVLQGYLDTGDWSDKAGGYGYQSAAAYLISRIDGCYYNVVGFPTYSFAQNMSELIKKKYI